MRQGLLKQGIIKYCSGVILLAVLLFIPAGTLNWFYGWLFMGILFIPMLIAGIVMYVKAPALLRSRLKMDESSDRQKEVVGASALIFIAVFLTAGFNERFHWCSFPKGIIIAGCVIFLLSYAMFAEVLRENAYLSRVVEVTENQKVIDDGLYGLVRHPMYSATVFLFLSMPVILNAPFSFLIMLLYIPTIMKRIKYEEAFLEEELPGYREYRKKVKYRLIPFIW